MDTAERGESSILNRLLKAKLSLVRTTFKVDVMNYENVHEQKLSKVKQNSKAAARCSLFPFNENCWNKSILYFALSCVQVTSHAM